MTERPDIPAGWYQDPDDPSRERRWDGNEWSDDRRPGGTPPPPPPADDSPEDEGPFWSSAAGRIMLAILAVGFFAVVIAPILDSGPEEDVRRAADRLSRPFAVDDGPAGSSCSDVVYFVEGTASSVSITVTDAEGDTEQATNRAVPLSNSSGRPGLNIGCVPSGQFLYISAQNEGESGTVTCRIEADGRTVAEATSTGSYVIATCDDVAP